MSSRTTIKTRLEGRSIVSGVNARVPLCFPGVRLLKVVASPGGGVIVGSGSLPGDRTGSSRGIVVYVSARVHGRIKAACEHFIGVSHFQSKEDIYRRLLD